MIRRAFRWGKTHRNLALGLGLTAGLGGWWAAADAAPPHHGRCAVCLVDGACMPNQRWGFHQTSWRRWPVMPCDAGPTAPGAAPGGQPALPTDDPPPKEKEDLDLPLRLAPKSGSTTEPDSKPAVQPDADLLGPLEEKPKVLPKVDLPDVHPAPPSMKQPDIKLPDLKSPDAKVPSLDLPDGKIPAAKSPMDKGSPFLDEPDVLPKTDSKSAPKPTDPLDLDKLLETPKTDSAPPNSLPKGGAAAPRKLDRRATRSASSVRVDPKHVADMRAAAALFAVPRVQEPAAGKTLPVAHTSQSTTPAQPSRANVEAELRELAAGIGTTPELPRPLPTAEASREIPATRDGEANPLRGGWSTRKGAGVDSSETVGGAGSWTERRNPLRTGG